MTDWRGVGDFNAGDSRACTGLWLEFPVFTLCPAGVSRAGTALGFSDILDGGLISLDLRRFSSSALQKRYKNILNYTCGANLGKCLNLPWNLKKLADLLNNQDQIWGKYMGKACLVLESSNLIININYMTDTIVETTIINYHVYGWVKLVCAWFQ